MTGDPAFSADFEKALGMGKYSRWVPLRAFSEE